MDTGRFALAGAVAGLALLAVVVAHQAATPVDLADLAENEGARVTVAGRVVATASRVVTLADDASTVTAFLPRRAPLLALGDEATVTGVVERAGAGLAIAVQRVASVTGPRDVVLDVAAVTAAPQRFVWTPVVVTGVARASPHGWSLTDTWGHASVALAGPVAWHDGATGRAFGELHYDGAHARYRLVVDAWRSPS